MLNCKEGSASGASSCSLFWCNIPTTIGTTASTWSTASPQHALQHLNQSNLVMENELDPTKHLTGYSLSTAVQHQGLVECILDSHLSIHQQLLPTVNVLQQPL